MATCRMGGVGGKTGFYQGECMECRPAHRLWQCREEWMDCVFPYTAYFPHVSLEHTVSVFRGHLPYFALIFVFQHGPPGIYQPGQITDRTVLNVYGGLTEKRVDGYLLDKYKVRILMFYYCFQCDFPGT